MVVASRFSGFISRSYSTLQHLATLCNNCNNFEILFTGVARPPELLYDDGDALFLVVSMISSLELMCIGFSFQCMQCASPRLVQDVFIL